MIWHNHTADEVLQELNTDREAGLSEETAQQRLAEYGENRLQEKPPVSLWRRFVRQLQDAMVLILLLAAAVSLALCLYDRFVSGKPADWVEPVVIVGIVLLNAVLGVVQESRAEAALAALQALSSPNVRVRRDGQVRTVPASEVVPGDIV